MCFYRIIDILYFFPRIFDNPEWAHIYFILFNFIWFHLDCINWLWTWKSFKRFAVKKGDSRPSFPVFRIDYWPDRVYYSNDVFKSQMKCIWPFQWDHVVWLLFICHVQTIFFYNRNYVIAIKCNVSAISFRASCVVKNCVRS